MKTALIVSEIQNDYFSQGRMPLEKSQEVLQKATHILRAAREKKFPIIHLQHQETSPHAFHFLPCTRGVQFHPAALPERGEIVIKKHYANGFKDTLLLATLKKLRVQHLVFVGMKIQGAIDATVRAAYDLDYFCTVIYDACAAEAIEFNQTVVSVAQVQAAFLSALRPHYANTLSTEMWIQSNTVEKILSGIA